MRPLTPEEDAELERAAEAEVRKLLGGSVTIRAATFTEAVAQAEKLKATHNIMTAINSLWTWYCALPVDQQKAIGEFAGRRPQNELWMKRQSLLRKQSN